MANLRRAKLEMMEWEKQETTKKQREHSERARRELERRMNPQSVEDFDLLYHALEGMSKVCVDADVGRRPAHV